MFWGVVVLGALVVLLVVAILLAYGGRLLAELVAVIMKLVS